MKRVSRSQRNSSQHAKIISREDTWGLHQDIFKRIENQGWEQDCTGGKTRLQGYGP